MMPASDGEVEKNVSPEAGMANKKTDEEIIDRQNIDVLLDAVDAENAAARNRVSTGPNMAAIRPPSRRPSTRRNIDMLLDAVESTEKAEAGRVEEDSFAKVNQIGDATQEMETSDLIYPSGESGVGDSVFLADKVNVVVEKVVTYLGEYERCQELDSGGVLLAVQQEPPVTVAKPRRRGAQPKQCRKRVKRKKKKVVLPPRKSVRVDHEDDRSCTEMVVPVDPRSLGRAKRQGHVSSDNDSDDDCSNLMEVEVPIPFRSVPSKEVVHSQEAINFALSHNLMRKFKTCPRCGKQVALNTNNLTFRCSRVLPASGDGGKKKRCEWYLSAKSGTWFEKTCTSLQGILHITFLWLMMRRPRQAFVMAQLGCSTKTVVDWASYCREVCVFYAESTSEVIGGEERTVELYEPRTVNRKRKGTQIMDGSWIFGGYERESGKLFVVPVTERSKDTLLAVVKKWIRPDTTVVSDCWRSLKCLNDVGFRREMSKNGYSFVDPEKGENIERVEQVWQEVRCSIPRSGPCDQQLLGCLSEFMFKRKFGNAEARTLHFFETVVRLYPGN